MTDHDQVTDRPSDDACAIVEAFIDGEAVDRAALRRALDDPAARDHLLDALILRDAIGAMAPAAWTRTRGKTRRATWFAAAAAVAIMSLTAGYVAGLRTIATGPAHTTVETSIDLSISPAAPAPTHVVTLQPGVNWTEGPGGR